jgi:hypothetical protein
MRLHLVPKIFNKYADVTAELVSVEVPEIRLTLVAGIDIVTRRPYPNKAYHVACRKKGRKAITGLFVDVEEHLANFTVSTTWKVNKKDTLVHKVIYTVADRDYGAVTDDHVLINGFRSFQCRSIGRLEIEAPVHTQPRMDVIFDGGAHSRDGSVDILGFYSSTGMLIERHERITVPTIEVERLSDHMGIHHDRMPEDSDAFIVDPADA